MLISGVLKFTGSSSNSSEQDLSLLETISKSLEHYRMLNDYLITIDIDWAPDSAISETAHYLIENEVKATWFITHASPEIEKLKEYPHLFELDTSAMQNNYLYLGKALLLANHLIVNHIFLEEYGA